MQSRGTKNRIGSRWSRGLRGAVALSAAALGSASAGAQSPEETRAREVAEALRLPLCFQENRGQWADSAVLFSHRGPSHQLRFESSGFALLLANEHSARGIDEDPTVDGAELHFAWPKGRASVPIGEEPLVQRRHYFRGTDPSAWTTGVRTFGQLRYAEVFPGIDLVVHGRRGVLEYDFVVAPEGDPSVIELEVTGPATASITESGNLRLDTVVGPFEQEAPIAYQGADGVRREIDCRFELDGNRVRFAVAEYDRSQELVIDPVLVFGSYLGGSGFENTLDCTVDAAGSLYVCGLTMSPDYPVSPGAYQGNLIQIRDCFVAKMKPDGSDLEWATYLGGNETRTTWETAHGIRVDAQGVVTIAGADVAQDFPTTPGAYQTYPPAGGFVSRLSADGSQLLFSTLIHDGDARGLEVNAAGDCYVVGEAGANFEPTSNAYDPTFSGVVDAFALLLDTSGGFVHYATFLGGSDSDTGLCQDLLPDGSCVVGGFTRSTDFPTTPGAFDQLHQGFYEGFVSVLSPDGSSLVASTFLGGTVSEIVYGLRRDDTGRILATGWTSSPDFPTTQYAVQPSYGGGASDVFVTAFPESLDLLDFSTFVGGSESDSALDLDIHPSGSIAVVGETWSTNYPTTDDALDDTLAGERDAFVTVLDRTGSQIHYSTLLGGADRDTGFAIALADDASILAVGNTSSTDFPTTPGAFQETQQGNGDTFVVKLTPVVLQPDLGYGGPGDARLVIHGDELSAGNFASLELSQAPADAIAFLILGLSANPTPFAGGTWVPMPPALILRSKTDAEGRILFPGGVPGGGGPLDLYAQFLLLDPAQPRGIGFSNAVKIVFLR